VRRARQAGQALTEMALAVPFIVGLLALTLQGGLVISDQVNIEHFAYEGAQWAVSHPDQTANQVRDHIYKQMCGGTASSPSVSATSTRYCLQEPAGLANLVVSVTAPATPSAMRRAAPFNSGVLAAATCNPWYLTVTASTAPPSSPGVSEGANSTATYVVNLHVTGGSGSDPVVTLSASGYPPGLANGSPRFNPPAISSSGGSYGSQSNLLVSTGSATVAGSYSMLVTGQDQCGNGPSSVASIPTLSIQGAGTYTVPAVPAAVTVNLLKDPICANTPSVVTITGTGFQAGATVTLSSGTATVTSVTSSTQIVSTLTAGAGIYNIIVTNPDTSQGVGAGVLRVVTGSPCPPVQPAATARPCAAVAGSSYRFHITITWIEPIALPLFTTNVPPSTTLTAIQDAFCQ
jgi:hypothetical protein